MGSNHILTIGGAGLFAAAAAGVLTSPNATAPGTQSARKTVSAEAPLTDADAVRLAKQATFGPTPAVVARIKALGINGWLDEQFAAKSSSFEDLAGKSVTNSYCSVQEHDNPYCIRVYRDSLLPAVRFYRNALSEDDQLRQRVALALFNIMPVSGIKTANTAGLARYQQILLDNAFGNYRDVLRQVVTSAAMGNNLDLVTSTRVAPNENLARELMQLFTIGPVELDQTGAVVRDQLGSPLPNYTNKDVGEIARALTGWRYTRFPNFKPTDTGVDDYGKPLVADPDSFDSAAKSFLGISIPAGTDQQSDLDAVIDRLVTHPSIAPRISRLLIRALVKSNPTPAYVGRVARVFRNNGAGQSGDLRAVIRSILTDREARMPDTSPRGGKLKDTTLLLLSVARAVNLESDGYAFTLRDQMIGLQFLRTPSVFGDYPDDYPLGRGALVSGPSKLMSIPAILERHNFVWQWVMTGDTARIEYLTPTWIPGGGGVASEDWSPWEAFGDNVDGMINQIDLLLLNQTMTTEQRTALRKAMILVTDPSPTLQARRRAQTGIFVVASSPQFQIDR